MGAIPTVSNKDNKKDRTLCTACTELKTNSPEFTRRGVTDAICESLAKDQGFNPESESDTCDDLKAANECLIKGKIEELPMYDNCDWKCFAEQYLKNQYNMNEAMICAICGLQEQLYGMYSMFYGVDTRFNIEQTTQGMKMEIDRSGNWHYHHDDWDLGNGQGHRGYGDLYGSIEFCMGITDNSAAMWRISSVTVEHYKYTFIENHGSYSDPVVKIRIPNESGELVYQKTLTGSFEDQINKTVKFEKGGTVKAGENSGWIPFAHCFTDWIDDDEGTFEIKFTNDSKQPMRSC